MSPSEINQLGRFVSIIHRTNQVNLNHQLALPGLTASNANILLFIFDTAPVTAKAIATGLAINKGLVSRELTTLQAAGYVVKTRDDTDARNVQLTLTKAGSAAAHTVTDLMATWWQAQFKACGLTDLTPVYAALGQLAAAFVGGPLPYRDTANED